MSIYVYRDSMNMNIVTPESVGFSSRQLNRIGKAMQGYMAEEQLPGLPAGVIIAHKLGHPDLNASPRRLLYSY